jgi:hypothetical protein
MTHIREKHLIRNTQQFATVPRIVMYIATATATTTSIRRRSLLRSPAGACRRWPQPPSTNIRVMIRALWLVYYAIVNVIIGNGIASVVVLPIVYGMPYALLVNKAPKCSTIEAPSFTTLTFHYHAPGMNVVV